MIPSGQKVLLAVSGGIDSMVMIDLFRKSPFQIAVAHCNFQLRGDASDDDEGFIEAFCYRHQLPFYTRKFATQSFADTEGISIQMAARTLRYAWFEELMDAHQFDLLATAHHLNDSLETVLLNFVRGSGLDGLIGIPERNGKIIRPLLSFTKASIESYALHQAIEWREDGTNQKDTYDRNFVRHQVVPLLKKLNPSLEDGFQVSHERLRGAQELVSGQITELRRKWVEEQQGVININREGILTTGSPAVVLWYLLREYGFTYDQCKRIIEPHETGKSFYSESIRLTVDRGYFMITKVNTALHGSVTIESDDTKASLLEKELIITKTEVTETLDKSQNVGCFDEDSLKYPLKWRTWEPGDQFIPLGMHNHKKISDFLIDEKVSLPEKEKITVLESDGKICWVVGYRISDLFKVKPATKRVIIIRNMP